MKKFMASSRRPEYNYAELISQERVSERSTAIVWIIRGLN